jgi:hypothetical protein
MQACCFFICFFYSFCFEALWLRREAGGMEKPAGEGQPLMPAEEVVRRSGLGALVITSFLFEHYVHMIAPEAIEDAAASAEKFSDAVFMLGKASNDTGTFGAPHTTGVLFRCCLCMC